MLAIIRNNHYIYLESISQPEEDIVADRFSVKIDNYNRYVDVSQRGGWNGVYRRYDGVKHRLARPFLGELRKLCEAEKIPLVVRDCRPAWPYEVTPAEEINSDWLAGIVLDDHQVEAIRAMSRVECGTIDVPTGGGKGEILAGGIKAIRCPTVVLAEQLVIIDQLKARLQLREVVSEVGLFYAGKTPGDQLVIIGSIQSLTMPSKIPREPQWSDYRPNRDDYNGDGNGNGDYERASEEADRAFQRACSKHESSLKGFRTRKRRCKFLQGLVARAEMIMIDEADLCSGASYRNLFRYHFNGRRRYGFSGTIYDPDKPLRNLFVQEHLGSVIAKSDRRELERIGRIGTIHYYALAVGEDGNRSEGSAFDIAFREKVVENTSVHHDILAICETYPDEGTLVLVERDALGKALEALIPGSVFIHGKTPRRRREEVLAAFERRELKVIIGGKIVKRGLDLRGGCENLVIATGGKLWSNFNQQVGRAVRLNKRGVSRVFDFYFMNNRYLYNHSRARLRAIVDMGYRAKVIFRNGQQVDGSTLIAARFRRPKWNGDNTTTGNDRANPGVSRASPIAGSGDASPRDT